MSNHIEEDKDEWVLVAEEQEIRDRKINEIVQVIQAASRGWAERKHFQHARALTLSACVIQDNIRAYLEFKNWPWWRLFSRGCGGRNLDKELKDREAQIKELSSKLAIEKIARAELDNQLKEAEKKIAQLQDDLNVEKQNVVNFQDTNTNLKQDVAYHQRKVSYLENSLAEQIKLVDTITVARREAEGKVKELSAALKEEKEMKIDKELETSKELLENQTQLHTLQGQLNDEKLGRELLVDKKWAVLLLRYEEELCQARLRIDDLITSTSDQYMELKRLQEENANQRLDLEVLDEKVAQFNRGQTQLEYQLADLQVQLDKAITAKIKAEKQKKDLAAAFRDFEESFGCEVDANELHKKQQEIAELKEYLTAEQDRKTEDEETKKKLRKEIQTQEEVIEELERYKLSAERIRESLETEVEDFKSLQEELTVLKSELESEKTWHSNAEKRERGYKVEIDELRGQLEDEILAKERKLAHRHRINFEVQLEELKDQIDELEEQLVEAEESKNRKDIELEDAKSKIVDESVKFEENRKHFEKEIERLNIELEEERKARGESERERKRLESDVDDLNLRLEKEIKVRQGLEKAKKRLEVELKVHLTHWNYESSDRISFENSIVKLEEETAKLRDELDTEKKQKALAERTCKSLELQFEDIRTQMEVEVRTHRRANRQLENELEDLREQVVYYL